MLMYQLCTYVRAVAENILILHFKKKAYVSV